MFNSDFCPLKLGETQSATRVNQSVRGAEYLFANKSSADGTPLDGRQRVMAVVKNASGGALLPGTVVVFKSSAPGWEINGNAAVGTRGDGVVDPTLPAAGVANGDCFLMVVEGPTNFVSDGAGVLAFGNKLVVGATGGRVKIQVAAPADETAVMVQVNSAVGYAEAAAAAVAGTVFAGYFQRA